jgi:hypothetical protein
LFLNHLSFNWTISHFWYKTVVNIRSPTFCFLYQHPLLSPLHFTYPRLFFKVSIEPEETYLPRCCLSHL